MANEEQLLEPDVEEAPSLRETIESAVEEHAPEAAPTETVAEPKPVTPQAPAEEVRQPERKVPEKPGPPESLKPPSQWKPEVRQQWNKLPRQVQEEVLRREADNMRLIGSVGPKIRIADEVMGHIAPFAERLSANGVPPQQFMGDIFSTIHSLIGGHPQEKAEVIANIIQSYGIDLNTLDSVLSRRIRTPPEVQHARHLAAQANTVLQNQRNYQQYQRSAVASMEAEKHVAAFGADPKHEFLDDVRDLMADLIESGKAANLEDAYAAAVWANPGTRKILLQREGQARAANKHQRAQAARRASSSVSGSPTNGAAASMNSGKMSLRESLEAAFDEHTPL